MIAYINCIYATIAVKYETGKSRYPVLTYPEYGTYCVKRLMSTQSDEMVKNGKWLPDFIERLKASA